MLVQPVRDALGEAEAGRQRRRDQQHEKDRAEQLAAGHLTERQRQGLEDETSTATGIEAIGEDQREDCETRKHRDAGIHKDNGGGRLRNRKILRHVGAEHDQGTHADADREEGLADGGHQRAEGDLGKVGFEQEAQGGAHVACKNSVEHHDDDRAEQGRHQYLHCTLQA